MEGSRLVFAACLVGALFCAPLGAQSLSIYAEVYPPYQMWSADGRPSGYAVEVVREIQVRVGNHDAIQLVPWLRGYLDAKVQAETLLFTVARTPEREALFTWVGPIAESEIALFGRANDRLSLHSLDDARKLGSIGVPKEDVRDQILTKAGFTNLDRSPDKLVVVRKLMDGRIDAMAGATESIAGQVQAAGYNPRQIRRLLVISKVGGYLAFSKGTSEAVVNAWRNALQAMTRDGTLQRLHQAYFPSGNP